MTSNLIKTQHIYGVMNYPRLLLTVTIMILSVYAHSQTPAKISEESQDLTNISDTLSIEFPQGKSIIINKVGNNDSTLLKIKKMAQDLNNPDSIQRLRHISVVGAASPEGSVAINRSLSHKRADNIFNFLSDYADIPDSITSFYFLGRDWRGLRKLVEEDTSMPYRTETLALINEILENNQDGEGNLRRLQELQQGIPYRYMYRKMFPALRKSSLIFDYIPVIGNIRIQEFSPTLSLNIPDISMQLLPLPEMACKKCSRNFYMDLRTNMLLDLLILPNIGAEFYLGKNWSIVGNWMYGWWDKDNIHRYWRAYGGDLGVRYWFGRKAAEKPLTGHHVGVYGGAVTYDFEFGGKGHMGGRPGHNLWDRCNWFGGIEYGYSLPIARRLNIDFTIGLGYLGGKLLEYVPEDGHYVWQKTKQLHWFGPTKAEVSLVWLIGCGNFNKKGGDR